MNPKVAIVGEMAIMWSATLLLFHSKHPNSSWVDKFIYVGLPSGAAILILTALLTAPIDISPDVTWPVWFGLLIAGSSILYEGVGAASGLDALLVELEKFTSNNQVNL